MNVSLQNIDKVSALLTVKLEKQDYQEKVEKSLKTFRQKANMPGFRPGKVPMGLIKKQFGKSILAQEIDQLLREKVYSYLKENKVNILGEPLPDEERQQPVDFGTQEEFEFVFDIALAPEFKVSLDASDKIGYYTIDVTDEMIDLRTKMYTERNGRYEKTDTYADHDMMKGLLSELDENGNTKEGGISVENAVMMPAYMKDEAQKALFDGAKTNDIVVFNPSKAYEGNEAELSSLLKIEKEKVAETTSDFSFQIAEITRFVEGELTQELFDVVFGKDKVKTPEEFRAKIKESIAEQYALESDYKFLLDLRKYLMEKTGKLEFPDALLKRLMLLNNKEKDEAFVNENYDKSIEELTWHLTKEQLVEANGVKVEQQDVEAMAKEVTRSRFAQYGMMNLPEDLLEKYAKEMLQKKEDVDKVVDRVIESKLVAAVKGQVTLDEKHVSIEEFNKMLE